MTKVGGGRGVVLRVIGEFFVIVLGVLVALTVDAWAEGQRANELEGTLLESLATDLRTSLEGLRGDNDRTTGRAE